MKLNDDEKFFEITLIEPRVIYLSSSHNAARRQATLLSKDICFIIDGPCIAGAITTISEPLDNLIFVLDSKGTFGWIADDNLYKQILIETIKATKKE